MHLDHISRACCQRYCREDYTITLKDQFGRSICIDPTKDYLHFKGYRVIETLDKWIEDVEEPSDMKHFYKKIQRIAYTAPSVGRSGEALVIFSLLKKYVFSKEIVVLGNGVYDHHMDDYLSRRASDFTTREPLIRFMKLEDLEQELLDE
jgi:hypothetical protein